MFKALFNQGYSKKFIDRIEFRRKEYYENRRIQTIRTNAAKMALNWTHEYPTGTPLSYIRDDIIETWERTAKICAVTFVESNRVGFPRTHGEMSLGQIYAAYYAYACR